MNFIVVPLFSAIADLAPELVPLAENAKTNAKEWADKVETEEEKKIYLPNNGKPTKPKLEEAKSAKSAKIAPSVKSASKVSVQANSKLLD